MSGSNWELGSVSAHYEASGLNAGTISSGRGDAGGVSYGVFQLATNTGTVQEYVAQSKYGAQFHGMTPGSAAFDTAWKSLAKSDPGFGNDQRDFIAKSHYQPQVDRLATAGVDVASRGIAVKEAVWSTAVQYRSTTPSIVEGALQEKFGTDYKAHLGNISDKDFVSAVQDYKLAHVEQNFASSSALVRDSVRDRIVHEKADLVGLAEGRSPHYGQGAKAAPVNNTVLREGAHGAGVSHLQGQLDRLGYTDAQGRSLARDGQFGPATQHAVEEFQRREGLAVDGVVGTQTQHRLEVETAKLHGAANQGAATGAATGAAAANGASAGTAPRGQPGYSAEVIQAAQRSQLQTGVPASVTLAQWAIESNHGRAMPEGSNNPFGIKASGNQPSVTAMTREEVHGVSERIPQQFRKFDSIDQAFVAHGQLLEHHPAYAEARRHLNDPDAYANALTHHYATDSHYGQTLINTMRADHLYQYNNAPASEMRQEASAPHAAPGNAPTAQAAAAPARGAPASTFDAAALKAYWASVAAAAPASAAAPAPSVVSNRAMRS